MKHTFNKNVVSCNFVTIPPILKGFFPQQIQHEGHRELGRAPVQPQHSGEEKEEQEEGEGVEEEAEVEEML